MKISIVIPALNEEKNIPELYARLRKVNPYEIIFIDDGSSDGTYREMEKIAAKDRSVKVIKFRRNFGQSAAWDAGFKYATGDHIVTMDADLQNDPADIPRLAKELEKGYDVVSGWRSERKDSLSKRFFSFTSRILRSIVIGDKLHDSGCSLKIYKKEALSDLDLYGESHRYIAEILALRGFKVGEIEVNHQPRRYGKTKYNIIRIIKGFLDLLMVGFWQKYSARPVHLFGGFGILTSLMGFLVGLYMLYLKIFEGESIGNRPLLLLAALLVIIGIQFLVFGILSDILVKVYYTPERKNYYIEKKL